jgi:hypothetical protein
MMEAYALAAVALLGVGAVVGFLIVISLGIRREENALSVTTPTSNRVARGTRAATGLHARVPGILQEVSLYRQGRWPLAGQETEW